MDVVVIVVEWNCIVTMKILLVSTDIQETAEMVIQDNTCITVGMTWFGRLEFLLVFHATYLICDIISLVMSKN